MKENSFDINMVLMAVFLSLESIRNEKKIELIYDIDATVPKELKGDAEVLIHLLSQILAFVLQHSSEKEIVLSLSAPKDFLYEESISFEIRETGMGKEKVMIFKETQLNKDLELLGGKIVLKDENPSGIHVSIPFKLKELGNRRYYRLPDMAMLGKKVLLICESDKIARSIQKMFKYFLYDVDVGYEESKKKGNELPQYDILVIEEKLTTDGLEDLVRKVQKNTSLKYVLLQDPDYTEGANTHSASAHLVKPVTQESIYELLLLLFNNGNDDRQIRPGENRTIISMRKYMNESFKIVNQRFIEKSKNNTESVQENHTQKEEKKEDELPVLDMETGEKNTKKVALSYVKELKKFLERFEKSDVYFRQIVNEKSTWQIKEFCIELEKQAKIIGAQRMSHLADQVSLLFIYDKLDTLPVYIGKYHIELGKLILEIKNYLDAAQR